MDRKSTKEPVIRSKPGAANPETKVTLDPDVVARRAYALYEARGRTPGHEWEDWLAAERALLEEGQTRSAKRKPRLKGERPRQAEA